MCSLAVFFWKFPGTKLTLDTYVACIGHGHVAFFRTTYEDQPGYYEFFKEGRGEMIVSYKPVAPKYFEDPTLLTKCWNGEFILRAPIVVK